MKMNEPGKKKKQQGRIPGTRRNMQRYIVIYAKLKAQCLQTSIVDVVEDGAFQTSIVDVVEDGAFPSVSAESHHTTDKQKRHNKQTTCLLYTSDAADE